MTLTNATVPKHSKFLFQDNPQLRHLASGHGPDAPPAAAVRGHEVRVPEGSTRSAHGQVKTALWWPIL